MRRVRWLVALALLLIPGVSQAIQLHWSSGADTLTFTEATRCMLVIQADSAEVTLPPQWRLLWVADSTEVAIVAFDSLEVCEGDTAQVYGVEGPSTPEDSTTHGITAHFCSGGSSAAEQATFVLDLPAWGRGKLKVVALDPADSNSVIESNEVTFNGGVSDPYPSVILCAMSVHQSLQLRVTAIGTGLLATRSLSIVAPDSSWSLPLTITAKSDNGVTAVASVAALLPVCEVSVESGRGVVSSATIPADEEPPLNMPASGICTVQYFEGLLEDPPPLHGYTIQPKDFAFAAGFVDTATSQYALHLFYIRHNYWYYQPPDSPQYWRPDLDEKNIGHIWTSDFSSSHGPDGLPEADTTALTVVGREGKFDAFHVWAPTIVQVGGTFHMFYTGVRNEGGKQHQCIGVATSANLNKWEPDSIPVLSTPDIRWASSNPFRKPYYGAQQLRDPFVMKDPVHSGQWLMYFVSLDSINASPDTTKKLRMAVGVARSGDLKNWTADPQPFCGTEKPTVLSQGEVVESPHVFRRNGQWWLPYTVDNNQIFFETSASTDPADTVGGNWTNPIWLRDVTQNEPENLKYWHASEYLQIGDNECLAAWNDNASSIEITGMAQPPNASDSLRLGCPPDPPIGDAGGYNVPRELRMIVTRLRWGNPEVGLRLELPSRMSVQLAVYDVAGRRRSTLLDRELPAGVTDLRWDGMDDAGGRIASGMYFIRLTCAKGARVSKVVMLR